MKPGELEQWCAWVDDGHREAIDRLRVLPDDAFAGPSRLPGWSRAHVASHLARNADACTNLLTWARTGVETPMYASMEQRTADIEAGAPRPAAEIRADVVEACRRYAAAVGSMDGAAWASPVRTSRGAEVTGAYVPWMRTREVWIHLVDLDAGFTFDAAPPALVDALLTDVAGGFAGRDDCPAVELLGEEGVWRLGPSGAPSARVAGSAAALLGWLLGRDDGASLTVSPAGAPLPVLPAWM